MLYALDARLYNFNLREENYADYFRNLAFFIDDYVFLIENLYGLPCDMIAKRPSIESDLSGLDMFQYLKQAALNLRFLTLISTIISSKKTHFWINVSQCNTASLQN